jgi:hypothetical protein
MRYRRRLYIPFVDGAGQEVGYLAWQDGAMEAWTATENLIGRYPTRKEAASALWRFMHEQGIRGRFLREAASDERTV